MPEDEKRSHERGKCERQMEHMGRVRRSKSTLHTKRSKGPTQTPEGRAPAGKDKRVTMTPGYVAIWAGLVPRGKRFLRLARQLFSSQLASAPTARGRGRSNLCVFTLLDRSVRVQVTVVTHSRLVVSTGVSGCGGCSGRVSACAATQLATV
jgi:hypothetical protein